MSRRKRMMEALDQDVRDFIERETQDNIERGMEREEARYAALRKFGNVTRVKEESWELWSFAWLEQLWQDVRFGLRVLGKSPGFTALAVLTLALGIGANTAIFSLIDSVMLRMLPVASPGDLLQVKTLIPGRPGEPSGAYTNILWEQVRNRQDVFSHVFAWGEANGRDDSPNFDLSEGGVAHSAHGLWVSGDFFGGLGLRPAAGRLIAPSDDRRGCRAIAVLSYGFWQERYAGKDSAIGASLTLGRRPFEVIGVAPAGFYGMEVGDKFDVAAPICAAAIFDGTASRLDDRGWWWLQIAGRAKPEVSRAQVITRLRELSPGIFTAALPPDLAAEWQRRFVQRTLTALPAGAGVSEFGLREQFGEPLDILMAVVGVTLLIACANIVGLMLARALARHREISVRLALGASRMRLVRQLLVESILLSCAGALLGLLFSHWGTALLVHSLSTFRNTVFLDLAPDGRVLGFTAAVAVLTGILFGILPAFLSTRVSLTSAMKGSQGIEIGRSARFHPRNWIVSSQIALSFLLLATSGLLLRSFAKLTTLDLGFDRDNVLLVSADLKAAKLPPEREIATYESIENRLAALPGVLSVGRSLLTPMQGGAWSTGVSIDGFKSLPVDQAETWFNAVSPAYFAALRMPLLAGRSFSSGDTSTGSKVAIVNQTWARRFLPGQNPIGRIFRIQRNSGQAGPPIEVVGIVRDSKYESVREATHPTAFFPIAQVPAVFGRETFEVRTAIRPSALVSPVQSAVASVNKGVSIEINTLARQVDDSLVQERLLAELSAFFGGLALILTMVGLYGALSYMVARRRNEFGVRMALGAQGSAILRLVARDIAVILVGGIVAGGLLSLAATRLIQNLLFGLEARDPMTLAAAAVVLSAVAFLAGYIPSRRASKVHPMAALRCE